jgi:zinc protease
LELLEELDLETSVGVYEGRFADLGDLTMVIVGSVDLEQLRPLVETYVASLPSGGRVESWRDIGIEYPKGVVTDTVQRGLEAKARVELVFTGDSSWSRIERYRLQTLMDVARIRLREVLREDRGGTYGVSVRGSMDRIPRQRYRVTIGFGCSPERVDELVADVFRELRGLASEGPDAAVLAKVQEQHRRQRELDLRDNRFWLGALAQTLRRGGDPHEILELGELMAEVTPEVIRETADRYLRTDNFLRVVLLPEDAGDDASGVNDAG